MVHKMPFENLHLLWTRQKKINGYSNFCCSTGIKLASWKSLNKSFKSWAVAFLEEKKKWKNEIRWHHHISHLESCIQSINSSHFNKKISLSEGPICYSLVISTSCLVSWILITYVKLHFHFQLHNLSCSISPGDKYYFSAKVLVCIIKVNIKVIRQDTKSCYLFTA